jgi:diguanylate cyclase (GGDEF)-like protein
VTSETTSYDPLTGFFNKAALLDYLDKALAYSKRYENILVLMSVDLDCFKRINDSLGYECAEQLLRDASQRLKECLRETDTVARMGSDEFVVVLPSIKDISDVSTVAEKIISRLTEPYNLKENLCNTGISIGISIFPKDGLTAEQLIRNSSKAMVSVKTGGGNNYGFFRETDDGSALL